jgi:hypothetical protein
LFHPQTKHLPFHVHLLDAESYISIASSSLARQIIDFSLISLPFTIQLPLLIVLLHPGKSALPNPNSSPWRAGGHHPKACRHEGVGNIMRKEAAALIGRSATRIAIALHSAGIWRGKIGGICRLRCRAIAQSLDISVTLPRPQTALRHLINGEHIRTSPVIRIARVNPSLERSRTKPIITDIQLEITVREWLTSLNIDR